MSAKRAWAGLGAALLLAGGAALYLRPMGLRPTGDAGSPGGHVDPGPPEYVGTARCETCHQEASRAWTRSHHDRAMEAPSSESVEAPFDGRTVEHDGTETVFRRVDGRHVVRTPGSDGRVEDFEVAWTFGAFPLQQYLLDVGGGRLQSLTVAWDTRPTEAGGQRFFSLYPDEELRPGDPLHWSGPMQNWNYVCADCHSTAYRRGYDTERGAFRPTWVEPDVGCEACHGPGSRHVAWADAGGEGDDDGLVVDLTNRRAWTFAPGAPNATPRPDADHVEVDTCAPCHSRRHQVGEARRPDEPLLDFYRPELLVDPLYHADGQIDGEVYVYGSFLQSRMFHAGVRCSDCHDPHSLSLRADGDALCAGCHRADEYATPAHHHHAPDGEGAACVGCHMPSKVYMGVDARRDHSIRVPRPDLGVSLGIPSACDRCHATEGVRWAASAAARWWGSAPVHPATAFAATRRGDPRFLDALVALARDGSTPAIVRGTALAELEGHGGDGSLHALRLGARDPEPLVRLGAIYGARGLPPGTRLEALAPVLGDPLRVLRIEAARVLSIIPVDRIPDGLGSRLRQAQDELLASERLYADRADAWLRVASVEGDRGRPDAAEHALRRAVGVDPASIPALVNLADLARSRGDEDGARRWLDDALAVDPDHPAALHALGLLEVRAGRRDEAVAYLARAATLDLGNPRFAYVHAVALWDAGRRAEARAAVERALERHPFDPDLLGARRAYGQ